MFRTVFLILALAGAEIAAAAELVVYSARKEHLVKPLFDAYQAETGTMFRFITDGAGPLVERLRAEGDRSKADLLITVDAGNLWHAAKVGVLAAVDSKVLRQRVPEHLRDPQQRWFGLSLRARTIAYSTERVDPAMLTGYEALAGPAFAKRLCLRTSKKVYNQSLVAMLIDRLGEEQAEAVVRGWVANLATPVFAKDSQVVKAIHAGQCDVGIVNTYYFGREQRKNPQLKVALAWPNQNDAGVHVNVSGAGVTAHAPNRAAAIAFLEWLSGDAAQRILADGNLEYPVVEGVPANAQVQGWGSFRADPRNLSLAGELQSRAVVLMDRAGYR